MELASSQNNRRWQAKSTDVKALRLIDTCRIEAQAAAMAAPPGSAAPSAGACVRAASTDSRVASDRKAKKADEEPQPSLPAGGSMKNSSIPVGCNTRLEVSTDHENPVSDGRDLLQTHIKAVCVSCLCRQVLGLRCAQLVPLMHGQA